MTVTRGIVSVMSEPNDRARVELRLPEQMKKQLEALSTDSNLSLNALVASMLGGLLPHAHVGWPDTRGGVVENREHENPDGTRPLWFGLEQDGPEERGELWFRIDLETRSRRTPYVVTERDIR